MSGSGVEAHGRASLETRFLKTFYKPLNLNPVFFDLREYALQLDARPCASTFGFCHLTHPFRAASN